MLSLAVPGAAGTCEMGGFLSPEKRDLDENMKKQVSSWARTRGQAFSSVSGTTLKTHGMICSRSQSNSWVSAASWPPSQMASFLDLSEQWGQGGEESGLVDAVSQ